MSAPMPTPMSLLRIALTAGEPAGIGPDLTVQLAQEGGEHELSQLLPGGLGVAAAAGLVECLMPVGACSHRWFSLIVWTMLNSWVGHTRVKM